MNAPATRFQPLTERPDPLAVCNAPAAAFAFASPLQFEAADAADAGLSVPFKMLARTGDPVSHWYWGRIVHDFAGMRHRERIPVDYVHQTDEPIGFANAFDTSGGDLVITGSVEALESDDVAGKLIERARRGIPYQASIMFDSNDLECEYIDEHTHTEVNGRPVSGPLIIARTWTLRGVAICPHGHDVGSECELADAAAFSFAWKGKPMSKDSTQAPAETPVEAGQLSATNNNPAPVVVDPSSTQFAAYAAQLQKYRERFGAEAGPEYFAAGLDFPAACEKHIDRLSADLKTEREARQAVEAKIAAAQLSMGEAAPIESNAGTATPPKSFEQIFRRAG